MRRILDHLRASSAEMAVVAAAGAAVLGASVLVYVKTRPSPPAPIRRVVRAEAQSRPGLSPSPSPAPSPVVVHVDGRVASPGVYVLAGGSRVNDAIAAAGGPVEDAQLEQLNLAAPVADGQKVHVPRPGESALPAAPEAAAGGLATPGAKVNLNSATQAELESLPGIGPVLAKRILDFRAQKGRIASVKDLLNVEGFGPKRVASLKDQVTV